MNESAVQSAARSRAPQLRALALLAVFAASASAYAQQADPVRAIEVDTDNVRAAVRLIDSDLQTAIARERRYPLDRRFVEATLAYERGNLNTATVQLMDLVYTPKFQSSRDYYNALFMLGDSLYRMRNWMAARKYLSLVLKSQAGGKHFQPSLQALVDIAIRMRKFEEVKALAKHLASVPPGNRLSDLMYQFGRSFFAARQFKESGQYLSQIGVGDARWPNARFYIGAMHVQAGRLDDAVREFRDVVGAANTKDQARRPQQVVVDYANLALGRVSLKRANETKASMVAMRGEEAQAAAKATAAKLYADAVFHYQSVDRNSQVYEAALFEMAASHVAAAEPKKALEALDILLLTVSDDQVAVEAAVLRGRINLISKEYDAADSAYKDVVERYSAISGEMTRFATSNERLEQFFSWLLNRGSDDYSVVRPVTERVARFIERDEDMGRVVAIFDEMSAEKRDVKVSDNIARTIEAALKEGNRLDMFPSLKDGWLKLVENENRVVAIGERVVELMRKNALPVMNAEEKRRAEHLKRQRLALRTAFAKIPPTARAWSMRQSRVASEFNQLAAQISLLKAALSSLRDQILAIEKMLNERVYGTQGLALGKEREAEIRDGLQQEKDELRRVFRLVDGLASHVEIKASVTAKPGDKVSVDEAKVRGALLAAQRAEQQVYSDAVNRVNRYGSESARLLVVRGHLDAGLVQIGELYRGIGARATERTSAVAKLLAIEKANIAEYKVQVNAYEEQSRHLARTVGYTLIRRTQSRLADVVLEADLGMVDVAWQRKLDKATEIRSLQEDRSKKIKTLQKVLEDLSDTDDVEEAP